MDNPLFCARAHCCVLFLASLAAVSASAQKQHAAIWTTVQSVTVVPGDSPVIEIVSSRPLTPTLQTIEGPLRLVIDLPDSNLTTAKSEYRSAMSRSKAFAWTSFNAIHRLLGS